MLLCVVCYVVFVVPFSWLLLVISLVVGILILVFVAWGDYVCSLSLFVCCCFVVVIDRACCVVGVRGLMWFVISVCGSWLSFVVVGCCLLLFVVCCCVLFAGCCVLFGVVGVCCVLLLLFSVVVCCLSCVCWCFVCVMV